MRLFHSDELWNVCKSRLHSRFEIEGEVQEKRFACWVRLNYRTKSFKDYIRMKTIRHCALVYIGGLLSIVLYEYNDKRLLSLNAVFP